MIQILLSLAFAQPLPNELAASRTCDAIYLYHIAEKAKIEKENKELQKDCELTRSRLPKRLKKNMQCYQFAGDTTYMFINTTRFYNECRSILFKMDVKKHLYGPIRMEDFQRPVIPSWGE